MALNVSSGTIFILTLEFCQDEAQLWARLRTMKTKMTDAFKQLCADARDQLS